MIELQFLAVGQEKDGWKYGRGGEKQYNCSFTVTFDETKVNEQEVNKVVQEQIALNREYHPTSQIIQQRQRRY